MVGGCSPSPSSLPSAGGSGASVPVGGASAGGPSMGGAGVAVAAGGARLRRVARRRGGLVAHRDAPADRARDRGEPAAVGQERAEVAVHPAVPAFQDSSVRLSQ
ncbi:hypothetical protein BJF78_24290 [Pseudonocardia sp. CNS-139]|nr:hypothetical protein BJF78_24290 [Pseudonocardia sp. CNS-139]